MSFKSSKRKSHFRDEWLQHEDYKDWIKKVPYDECRAYCKLCMGSFSIAGSGQAALDIHAKGKKHLLKCPAKNHARIQLTPQIEKETSSVSVPAQQSIASFITKEEVLKAEIRWTLESLLSNYSFNSCSTKSDLFSSMFSDSELQNNFQWEKPNVPTI